MSLRGAAVVAFVVVAALAASWAPLLAYTTSLACFGLAHVVIELRYVDGRFGRRLPRSLWLWSAVGIAVIVALRGLRLAGVFLPDGTALELFLVASLLVVGAIVAWTMRAAVGVVGVTLAVVVATGAVVAPIETLLTLALLHNLTPMGFIVERAAPGSRLVTVVVVGLVFIGVPAMIASGLPSRVLGDVVNVERSFFNAGELSRHLGVYLWPAWQADDAAVARFSAAVCAQLLHYGAVLLWLPRSLADDDAPRLPWPSWSVLAGVVVVFACGLGIHFAVDFAGARAAYSLPAAVHAWLELPVLLVAFSALSSRVTATTAR